MTTTTDAPQPTGARIGLVGRIIGVLTSPGDTFAKIVQDPRPLRMLLVNVAVTSAVLFVFFSTEVGKQAWIDEALKRMPNANPQAQAGVERMADYAQYFGLGQALVGVPLVTLVMAGILFAIFNGFLGGSATFKQLFSVCVHSGAVSLLQQLIVFPLNYVRESMSSPTNLGALAPMLEETSVPAVILGMFDLFIIWWLIVLAIGLAVLYRRKASSIATGFFVLYLVIAVIVGFVRGGGS